VGFRNVVKEIIQECLVASGVSTVFKSSFNILYSELFIEALAYGY
jgi:hypothetical protein